MCIRDRLWVIPSEVYQSVMKESACVANYTNELMAGRFSEVMWLMEQVMWKSLDKRVAAFLLEEASIGGSSVLKITHEAIANYLGYGNSACCRIWIVNRSDNFSIFINTSFDIFAYSLTGCSNQICIKKVFL